MLSHIAVQVDPYSFETLCLAAGSGHVAVFGPGCRIILIILPADRLNVCCVSYSAFIRKTSELDPYSFKTLCLAAGSGHSSVLYISLPAVALNMSCVLDIRHRCYISLARSLLCRSSDVAQLIKLNSANLGISCYYSSLLNNNYLNRLKALCLSRSTCVLSVLSPTEPTVGLCLNSVVNIIILGHIARKSYLNSLKALCLSAGSRKLTVFNPLLPAIGLNMSSVFDTSAVRSIIQLYPYSLKSFTLSNRT